MKITIIGGASSNIPLIIKSMGVNLDDSTHEVVIFDIDHKNLTIVYDFCLELIRADNLKVNLQKSFNLKDALTESDIVINYFRKGNLEQRLMDQLACKKSNILGQETQGAMGVISAYRQLSVVRTVCEAIVEICPNAFLINISNPVNILTKASLKFGIKSVGLCELPWSSYLAIKQIVSDNYSLNGELSISWIGINHISWINGIYLNQSNIIQDFSNRFLDNFYENATPANIPSSPSQLNNNSHLIPAPYLFYYYNRAQALGIQANKESREHKIIEARDKQLKLFSEKNMNLWEAYGKYRGGYLVGESLSNFILSMNGSEKSYFPGLNIYNNGVLSFLGDDDIIETSVICDNGKIHSLFEDCTLPDSSIGLIQVITASNNIALDAFYQNNPNLLIDAMAVHPLIGDVEASKKILSEIINTL